jgi:hypothetical protein
MDLKYHEELLKKLSSNLYGDRIVFDKTGVFEWDKHNDGSTSYRSVDVVHYFKLPEKKKKEVKSEQPQPRVSYMSFKNEIYISKISEENTVDIYSKGGGMVKLYYFKIDGSNIVKIVDKVISIR